jgi:aspartyl-tRNA(Asn)/glutamyl-tRNA(Gln) amidotransferase subunit B
VLNQNPKPVADYLKGQNRALAFLVGGVMKETRGKANPAVVNQLLTEALERRRGD